MQTGDGYVFHLDAPCERPAGGRTKVYGWIAAEGEVTGLTLLGNGAGELTAVLRKDVEAAFPAYAHVTGFLGEAGPEALVDGALHFSFAVGGGARTAAVALPAPPAPARGWRRLSAALGAAVARLRLLGASSPAARWNAGVSLLLARARLQRGGALRRAEGDAILECFACAFRRAVVLQIGANDGAAGDPLARFFKDSAWTGVLVEPIPHLADALTRNHAGRKGVVVERAAISERNGEVRIFRLADEPGKTPVWFQQLASLDRNVLVKHRSMIPDIESRIVEEVVPSMTVATLLERHGLLRVDLLVIDTEGHDYRILNQFDFSRVRPIVVMFEHQHLAADEKASAYGLLSRNGYQWIETPEGDSLAWRRADRSDSQADGAANQA
jgi:FkbM family methyltransferase